MQTFRSWLTNNALSLLMIGLFVVFLVGLSITGFYYENEELARHGWAPVSYGEYVVSGTFIEAIFENWESEFLQMWALVIFTVWLRQKGSADSKKIRGKEDVDTSSRYSILRARTRPQRRRAIGAALYGHSLGLALLSIFIVSFLLHAVGGVQMANDDALMHNEPTMTVWQYISSSQFWFESFQNWQSEFLSVGTLLILSIYLRERHSPESKPVAASNQKTGH